MNLWNKIFRKADTAIDLSGFEADVKKSIDIIANSKSLDSKELLNSLVKNGIEERAAVEIVLFLPIAFIRKWLTDVHWPKTYLECYPNSKRVSRRFSDNQQFTVMEKVVDQYWNEELDKDVILSIAGRSAEFDAINQLLHDGGKLEDIKLTETVIIR